ncbi:hypothetical protein FHS96_003468 [Sphingomonas zeicaulis]|uniref:hypothetical protein n=1 Tax=Sphingomonas zeicaulis TaxID=1632740 RepID=UPI003D20BB08
MSGETRGYTFDVSEGFFRLTTECLRLRSNETLRYQSLASLLEGLVPTGAPRLVALDGDVVRDHLVTIATRGSVRLFIRMSRESADLLVEAKRALASRLNIRLTVADAMSVLLLDYIIAQKADNVMRRIGRLDVPPAPAN